MRFIGIDPGASGGIATLGDIGEILSMRPMPDSRRGIWDAIAWLTQGADTRVVLEHVTALPPSMRGTQAQFGMGRSTGWLEMALEGCGTPFSVVVPRKWQKALGVVYPKDSNSTAKKNLAKARAQELFPGVKLTHALADALMIAEYCRLTEVRK